MTTVLVIEDNENFRTLLRAFLEDAGYEVVEAEALDAGLSVIENQESPFAAALIDFWLAGQSALPVLDRLRVVSPATAIILITGGGPNLSIEASRSFAEVSGPLHFLQKPFGRAELLKLLHHCVS